MGGWRIGAAIGGVTLAIGLALAAHGGAPAAGPAYTADGKLLFPEGYRDWAFLTSGFNMAYVEGPEAAAAAGIFDNVFVNREAVDGFKRDGVWPDKTEMVLEIRRGQQNGSINKRGRFQTDPVATEVHVKDTARFKDNGGWAFFAFRGQAPAQLLPATADCYTCHRDHGATDTTFVQFYPTLAPIARAKGTFKETEAVQPAASRAPPASAATGPAAP
ncbi:MAG: cytochrome P460 family protein [Caulobacteraceae bacterium]